MYASAAVSILYEHGTVDPTEGDSRVSDSDSDGESVFPGSERSPREFDGGRDLDASIANTMVGDRTQWPLRKDASKLFWMLVTVQTSWMVLMVGVLFALDSWSLELYFILSFLGLLGARLLFAPSQETPRWWTALNWAVYAGLVVLGYIFFQQLDLSPA